MKKALQPIIETYPDHIQIYQDDVAVSAPTIKLTEEIAILVKDQMKLAGLICNEEKTFWDATSTKPLLGATWSPMKIYQKDQAIIDLQKLHEKWRTTRLLKDRQRFQGKLASLGNFPGVIAEIAANEKLHGPESKTIDLLKQIDLTKPDVWCNQQDGKLFVDASDSGIGAILQTNDGKTLKTLSVANKLHIPIFELEFVAVWKGVTKLRQAMKRFAMNNIEILSDNQVVVKAFNKGKMPASPTAAYYLTKTQEFMAKEKLSFTVAYVPSKANIADYYSRATEGFSKSLWIRYREAQESLRKMKTGI
eukprot:GHVP01070346.1.p1 GENE.GHVP01070346.1~~GHVP01070346.1.p1  ORF type:complete len:306 (+),score=41.72 GHVP01070346.1:139-1056(+)